VIALADRNYINEFSVKGYRGYSGASYIPTQLGGVPDQDLSS